jgi:hypothetical protein
MEIKMQNFKVKKLQWRETEKGYISECGKYFIMKTGAGKYFPMKNDKKAISDIFFFTENTSNFFTLKEDAMRSAQKHLDAYVKKCLDQDGNIKPLEWSIWGNHNYLVSDCSYYFITECYGSDYLYVTAHRKDIHFNFTNEDKAKEFLNSWHREYILSSLETK